MRFFFSSFLDCRGSDKKGEVAVAGDADREADGVAVALGPAEVALAGAFWGADRSAFRSCLCNCFSAFRCSLASSGRPNAGGADVDLAIVGVRAGVAEISGDTEKDDDGLNAGAAVALGDADGGDVDLAAGRGVNIGRGVGVAVSTGADAVTEGVVAGVP